MRGLARAAVLLFAALGWWTRADALDRLPAVVHLHSELTTGDFPLDKLARMAEEQGIEALLLSENYLLRLEYGLPPFRALTRITRDERSVLDGGIERYLAGLDEVRRAHPRVLLVAGVEVMPHYFWTGSPLALSMELHNTQKNILVFGVAPEALHGLPVTGNRSEPRYGAQSVLDAAPALLLVPGLVLLLTRRLRRRRLRRAVVLVRGRSWLAGSVLIAIAVITLVRGWPFRLDRYPPWQDFGEAPYQALIDHVDQLGGATVWSFPEAPDFGEEHVGPVRVQFETKPYPDDLLKTFRYTAFGALYEQATRVADPGGVWDRLLVQYVAGERSRPAWALGESGFHGLTSGKRLGAAQTVFLTSDKTEAGVVDALRRGRLYALQRTQETALVLTDFAVVGPETAAEPGEVLRVKPGTVVDIRVAVESSDGSAQQVRITLLRNGGLAEAWAGQTPFRTTHRSTFNGAPLYFRLDVRGRPPQRLLTSPIFVVGS